MTTTTTRRAGHRAPGRPLRSPLASPSGHTAALPTRAAADEAALAWAEVPPRTLQLSEFASYLRTVNNRDGRPYDDSTVKTYVYLAKALDRWMEANHIHGDFTVVDTIMLNRYFREYFDSRGQGGTNAQQRNLLQLFNFLQREYGHQHPYTVDLNRYAEVKGRPKTLASDFVSALLDVTGGGRAREFEDARDYAIIRILRSEGVRRCELLSMVMHQGLGIVALCPFYSCRVESEGLGGPGGVPGVVACRRL
jgi:integrase